MLKLILAATIFIIVLILVITKPGRLNEAVPASIGAVAVLIFGVVSLQDVYSVLGIVWNATFALIAIMIISAIMDGAGFFRWAAVSMAGYTGGSGRKLFLVVMLLGSLITIFFNNDGTVLILTPIIFELMEGLGFDSKRMLPFLFACGFIADTASVPLKVSNLVNIINSDYLGIDFVQYLYKMLLPGLIGILASFIFIYLFYRKSIDRSFDISRLPNAKAQIVDKGVFTVGVIILGAIIIGYFVGALYNIPISVIAVIGAVILTAYCTSRKNIDTYNIIKKAPWHIIVFAFGMYLIVFGLNKQGFSTALGGILNTISGLPRYAVALISGSIFSAMAASMNNLPSVMSGAITISSMVHNPQLREIMILANAVGNDIGAKLTPVGSLATLMWIYILGQKGVRISNKEYMKAAVCIIPPILVITLLALAV